MNCKYIWLGMLCAGMLAGCKDNAPVVATPVPVEDKWPKPNESRYVTFGPGRIIKLTEGQFAYQEDDGRIFESQSSLYYDAKLAGKHCESVRIYLQLGQWADQIDGKGCKP